MWLVYGTKGSDKVPFEDSVLDYIKKHQDQELTTADVVRDLGIGVAAVALAVLSLEEKGILATEGA